MYIKRQTRVSIFLHPSVSPITPGYRAWNKNLKTSYSAFLSRLPKKRKPLRKLLAACRTTPHFVTMQQHNVCLQNKCVMSTPFSTVLLNAPHPCLPLLLHVMKWLMTTLKIPKKIQVAAPVCLMHTLVFPPACSTHLLPVLVSPLAERPMTLEKRKQVVGPP